MDYELKYKNALEWARQVMNGETGFIREEVVEVFPELAESEDERIRNGLIALLKFGLEDGSAIAPGFNETKEQAIAWLEKQRKTKWSDEDEIGSDATIELLEYFINYAPEFRRPAIRRSIDWLKSLKQRMEG